MPVKQIKEINRDLSGNVFVEYADDSTTTFNVADTNPVTGRIKLTVPSFADYFASCGNAAVRKAIGAAIESGGYIGCLGDSTVAVWANANFGYGFSASLLSALGPLGAQYSQHKQSLVPCVAGNNDVSSVYSLTASGQLSLYASPMGWATAATIAAPQLGTAMRFIYSNGARNFNIVIDGGATLTPTLTGLNTVGVYTATGLTYGKHTAVMTMIAGGTGSNFNLIGSHTYNPSEPCILNFGAGGANTGNVYQTFWYSGLSIIGSLAAKICFIRCYTNDVLQAIAPATTVSNLMAIAASLTAANVVPCFLPPVPLQNYDAAMASLWTSVKNAATTAGYTYVDYGDDWFGTYASAASAGLMLDDRHFNAAGAAREAVAFRNWVGL